MNRSSLRVNLLSWGKEPLVRFLLLGVLILSADRIIDRMHSPRGVEGGRVEVTADLREQLRRDFQLRNRRAMSPDEERAEVAKWVEEELLFRTALRLHMHEADTIVRRRLVQRMRFVHEDMLKVAEPTPAQLDAYIARHPTSGPNTVTFDHVFLARSKHPDLDADATATRAALSKGEAASGDSMPVPFATADQLEVELSKAIGPSVTSAIMAAPLNEWAGPFESAYGLHMVRVRSRAAKIASDATKRAEARRALMDEQQSKIEERLLAQMRTDFEVVGEEKLGAR